jgi:inward rectifier potassium channel
MARRHREQSSRTQIGGYVFTKKGVARFDLTDPYHVAVSLTWPQFLAAMLCLYLSINLMFATLYTMVPGAIMNARPHDFFDSFFFSLETLATVGYGEMYPGGLYGHIISSVEICFGLAMTAILTGLTFVRFARPRAKFIFAENPVVAKYNGKPTLMLRVGNGRAGVLSDAHAKLTVLLSETTHEGTSFRRAHDLHLQRSHNPIFPLTWTLMHVIDDSSPLHGIDPTSVQAADARVFLSFEAYDPMLSATVKDVRTYAPQDVRFGMRYMDVIGTAEDGTPMVDLTKISALEPDIGPNIPYFAHAAEEEETE